jgi:hypothetical protein
VAFRGGLSATLPLRAPERPTTGKVRVDRHPGAIQNESLNAHGLPPLYPGEV